MGVLLMTSVESVEAFRHALNNVYGEVNEAARLSRDIFSGDEAKFVRRELARIMELIDSRLLTLLEKQEQSANGNTHQELTGFKHVRCP